VGKGGRKKGDSFPRFLLKLGSNTQPRGAAGKGCKKKKRGKNNKTKGGIILGGKKVVVKLVINRWCGLGQKKKQRENTGGRDFCSKLQIGTQRG